MEALALKQPLPDPISPEGFDCTDWFNQISGMSFWNQIEVIACEYSMVSLQKSLGGQLDLLCRYKGKVLLVDAEDEGGQLDLSVKGRHQRIRRPGRRVHAPVDQWRRHPVCL